MSFSMSPPQKPAPSPFPQSAYQQQAASPTGYGQPPAKRPRLSPDARSSPQQQNGYPTPTHGLPSMYGNPYAPPPPVQSPYSGSPGGYAGSPQSSFNTPQYHPQWQSQPPTPAPQPNRQMSPQSASQAQSSQMMPPPPRPSQTKQEDRDEGGRGVNIDDIGDSLYGSGVSLKDEESYLHNAWANRHANQDSFASTQQGTSFGSTTMSPSNSFNLLTQGTSFTNSQQAFAGTMGPTRSQESIDEESRRRRETAARARNTRLQKPMNDQFLQTNPVRHRLQKRAGEEGVQADLRGLYQRQPLDQRTQMMMNGAGTEGVAAVDTRPEFTAGDNEPFSTLMSLICEAGEERLRGLLGEALALGRARKYGDHGRVPPDWADIAVGPEGQEGRKEDGVRMEGVTGSQWDRVPDAADGDAPMINGDGGEAENERTPQPQSTISFQSAIASTLRDLATRDREAEDSRIKKREARRKAAEAAANEQSAQDSAAEGSANEAATAAANEPPKMTKKEIAKQAKEAKAAKASEIASASSTNQTAAMMALGKKGSRYSWMSGGAAAASTNRYSKIPATGAGSGTATPSAAGVKTENAGASPGAVGPGAAPAIITPASDVRVPEWGDWVESHTKAVDVRDWVLVLERDGKQKMALQRVLNGLT